MKWAEIPSRNKEMARRWNRGESAEALAEEFGLSPRTVIRYMNGMGYRRPDRRAARNVEIAQARRRKIAQRLREGGAYEQIADELGLSVGHVRKLLPAAGQTRGHGMQTVWREACQPCGGSGSQVRSGCRPDSVPVGRAPNSHSEGACRVGVSRGWRTTTASRSGGIT